MPDPAPVRITYRNHRNEVAPRTIIPRAGTLRYGTAPPWRPDPTYLFDALDVDRGVERTFAMPCVLKWNETPVQPAE